MATLAMMLVLAIAAVCFGALTALAIWLRLIFALLDALVQQVPRGVMLFLRLATWIVVRSVKTARYLWLRSRASGVWAAQHVYVWLFIGSFLFREWYVTSELKRRNAH